MIKLKRKQQILVQLLFIGLFLIFTIPLGHKQSIINLVFPNATIQDSPFKALFFINLIIAIFSFLKLRRSLIQQDNKWRYLLYCVIFLWFVVDIKDQIGEQLMNCRKGLNAVEFQFKDSEICYQKDTLGMLHLSGYLKFKNFSSDTVVCKGIVHGKSFYLGNRDSIGDICFPNDSLEKDIIILPKETYVYHLTRSKKLKINNLTYSKYSGTISIIRRLTLYSKNEKKIFVY